ncbi:MAG: NAD(P)/FAD-dependent oxidoreductase [Propionibacteriales bacterium]|nr:NAD(P)/FAD-dependent oxidoreductase [Propionibacteriales bacterium]
MGNEVDVVVVGLGPGGESVATELANAGLEVVGIDKHLVGGECPYYGCIPSKMMIRAANVLQEGRRIPALAGTSTVSADWSIVAKRIADEATDHWDDKVAVDRLEEAGVRFVRGVGRLDGPRTVVVDADTFTARKGVVLNTGTEPGVPAIDGLADTPYWTNRDAVQLTEIPGSLIVLGGGAIGLEMAQAFSRFGVAVTVVEVAPRILSPEEPEASKLIGDVFGREGIQVLADATVREISYADGRFILDLDGQTLTADKLLVAAGRRPNLSDLGLDTVALDPDARSLDTDEHLRAAAGLWAVGDITGKGAYTHVSMYQAAIVVRDILGQDGPWADYRAVPRVTFTDPEVGSVGLSERQAREAGLSVRVGLVDLTTSARGWIHQEGNEGFIKVIEDADRGVLVGACVAGPDGGEVLSALAVAVHGEVSTSRLRSMIYAYPTFHRAIEDALKALSPT